MLFYRGGWVDVFEDYVMNVYFMIDIGVNFFTAIVVKEGKEVGQGKRGQVTAGGVLVTDRWEIAKNYLKGFFIIDLISSIPISWMASDFGRFLLIS